MFSTFWLVVIGLVIVVVAPLRKAFFGAWRFTVPATGGLVGGLLLAKFLMAFGVSSLAMLVLPFVFAFGTGAGGKAWLDQNLGPPAQKKP